MHFQKWRNSEVLRTKNVIRAHQFVGLHLRHFCQNCEFEEQLAAERRRISSMLRRLDRPPRTERDLLRCRLTTEVEGRRRTPDASQNSFAKF